VLWVAYESQFISDGTIRGYLAGIKDWSLKEGFSDPLKPGLLLKKVLRTLAKGRSKRLPKRSVTVNVLRLLRKSFNMRLHDHRCVYAMMATAVALLLRIGEAVTKSENATFVIRRMDWRSWTTHATLFLKTSKCDVNSRGSLLRCPISPDKATCAMTAVQRYINESEVYIPSTGPLFVLKSGKPLTRRTVVLALQRAASRVGLAGSEFNGISFRKGGALSLALAGVEDRIIQVLGRWSSDCYRRYLTLTDQEIDRAIVKAASTRGQPAVEWAQPNPQHA